MFAFYLTSLVLIASALGVIVFRNPIYSALSLIVNLLAVAVIFAVGEAHFLAVVQVIVYAGAIMVLVMFVLMLLNVKIEPLGRYQFAYLIAGALLGVGFLYLMVGELQGELGGVVVRGDQAGTVKAIGEVLYTRYLFPFEAASILIMAAIVGAVLLAKRKYRNPGGV